LSPDEREAKYGEAVENAVLPVRVRQVIAVADQEQAELRAEVERLESNLSTLLSDLTGGRLSKATYDVRAMVQAVEENRSRGPSSARPRVEPTSSVTSSGLAPSSPPRSTGSMRSRRPSDEV
jgi:anti-sigma factor ChrR (cupin superfamily)